ncbi:MAG: hypothetical protein JJU45_01255 [Acidimicrobiia bacterium]|nr:hypothetical protein [Acidimicrobiia bacterium]
MSDPWPAQPGSRPPLPDTGRPPTAGDAAGPLPGAPGTGGPPGPPGQPSGGSVRLRWAALVAIVVLAGLLGGGVAYLVLDRTDDTLAADDIEDVPEESAGPTPPTPTEPGAPSPPTATPPSPIDEAAIRAEVEELSRFVEAARGLEFQEPVDVEILPDDAFAARVLEEFDEEVAEELALTERIFGALGMIEPGTDLVRAVEQLYGEGILGFYDPETGELVVRGGELTPYVRQTIVHELVHALDDQWFELHRPEYDDRDDEIAEAFLSVVEGNAVIIEQQWIDTLSDEERRQRDLEEARFAMNMDVSNVPPILFDILIAPYEQGELFVQQLLRFGGQDALDEAFREPPDTTEQILHFDKFLVREPRIEVDVPPYDGELLDDAVFGERAWRLMLGTRRSAAEARSAASGWGGDWYVAYEPEDGGTCVRIDVTMDTPADLAELGSSLQRYAEELPDATVEDVGRGLLRFTSCVDAEASGGSASPL